MRVLLLMVVVASLLAGCGTWPMNAQEFRERASQNPIHSVVDTFEVARPLQDVASVMRKKSAECLDVAIKLKRGFADAGTITYKPTFISHANRAELHVQRKAEGTNEHLVQEAPPDGLYEVVLDATPVSANRTKVVVYRMDNSVAAMALRSAVTHWAKGDNLGCPTL